MFLTLVTPEKKVVTDFEIDKIIVPGALGELEVLPGHAPMVTTLKAGVLRYQAKGSSEYQPVAISWGYCEVYPKGVKVLAETAETLDELEVDRVENAKKLAETKLKEGLTVGDMLKYQRKLNRAHARLELLKNYSKNN